MVHLAGNGPLLTVGSSGEEPRDGQTAGWQPPSKQQRFILETTALDQSFALAAVNRQPEGAVWRSRGGLRP